MNVLLLCLIVAVYGGWVGWLARGLHDAKRDAGDALVARLERQVGVQRGRDVLAHADDVGHDDAGGTP